jgi:hypothetical protein
MTRIQNSSRHRDRVLLRHTIRMLGGVHRPPPPNYLAIACRALEQVIKIDKRLRPYMQEQIRLEKERVFREPIKAALDRVYGPDDKQPGFRTR